MNESIEEAERLFAEGEELSDLEEDADALERYRAAWDAIPDPKEDQDLAVAILAAIADSSFFLGNWKACRDAVQHAFRCGAGLDNLFLRLRLGQSLYELGESQEATNWMVPVYLMEGLEPFEDEDPKYLESFRTRLEPPPGGWPDGW